MTVPNAAIQRGNQGTYVFVVGKDHAVSVRPIKVGITEGDITEIVTGLTSGEIVVVDGTDKLRDGSKVNTSSNSDSGSGGGKPSAGGKRHHSESGTTAAPSSN